MDYYKPFYYIKIYLECAYAASTRILCGHIDLKICILYVHEFKHSYYNRNRFIGLCALQSHIRYNMKYNISVFRIMLVLQYVFYTSLAECKVISKIKSHLLCCKLTMFKLYRVCRWTVNPAKKTHIAKALQKFRTQVDVECLLLVYRCNHKYIGLFVALLLYVVEITWNAGPYLHCLRVKVFAYFVKKGIPTNRISQRIEARLHILWVLFTFFIIVGVKHLIECGRCGSLKMNFYWCFDVALTMQLHHCTGQHYCMNWENEIEWKSNLENMCRR